MDNTRYWKAFDNRRGGYYQMAINLLLKAFKGQLVEIVKALKDSASDTDISLGVNEAIDSTLIKQAIIEIYKRVGLGFAIQSYMNLKATIDTFDKKQEFPEDSWSENVARYIETNGIDRVLSINETTRDFVKNVLARAAREGLGIDEAVALVREEYELMARWRAARIARTEIVAASNRGAIIGADSTGLDYNKLWIATADGRTRDDHSQVDGTIVPRSGNFLVGGEYLEAPGDPKGTAGNVINCRCAIGFIPIR